MNFNTRTPFIALAVAVSLFTGACTSSDSITDAASSSSTSTSTTTSTEAAETTSSSTTSTLQAADATSSESDGERPTVSERAGSIPLGEGQFSDDAIKILLENLAAAYANVDGKWEGFDPNEHPVVINVRQEDRSHIGLITINFPNAEALGDSTPLSIEGTPFASAHRITNVNETDRTKLDDVANFDFFMTVADTDSFVINAGTDSFFNLTELDYVSTLLHEMFHRYQGFAFKGFQAVGQDVEGYDYSAENIALATLEERALARALDASEAGDREQAARYFAALRMARLDRDDRVQLDDAQEANEGSARYIEHLVAGDETAFNYHDSNYSKDLFTDAPAQGAKDHFGFGRWYASGSAGLAVLAQLGVDDAQGRLEAGESIASMIAKKLLVTEENMGALVDEAREQLDPGGEIDAQSVASAAAAETEGPIFGDDEHDHGSEDGHGDEGDEFGEAQVITESEIACLKEQGVDLESEQQISDDAWEACFADEAA